MRTSFRPFLSKSLTVITLMFIEAQTISAQNGCASPPFTSCNNPTPSTNINGKWEDYTSTWGLISRWTVTVANVTPGGTGTVTGTVQAPNPNGLGCPDVYYTANGTISPSGQTDGVDGSTTFSWTATSPNPSTTCGGYTPVTTMTYSGTIGNKSNDRGSGTWSRPGNSGSLTFWREYVVPFTETTIADGFSGVPNFTTQARFRQELNREPWGPTDPNINLFQGRQVFEITGPGTGTDGCYAASSGNYPGPKFESVVGTTWNVGYVATYQKNTWGWDGIGWATAGVNWYRNNIPGSLPCTATIPQQMKIVVNGESNGSVPYSNGSIVVTIKPTSLEVTRNGIMQVQP